MALRKQGKSRAESDKITIYGLKSKANKARQTHSCLLWLKASFSFIFSCIFFYLVRLIFTSASWDSWYLDVKTFPCYIFESTVSCISGIIRSTSCRQHPSVRLWNIAPFWCLPEAMMHHTFRQDLVDMMREGRRVPFFRVTTLVTAIISTWRYSHFLPLI